jgi:Putative adhesin
MPTFDTQYPISVRIQAGDGSVHLVATDRTDTVVEVRPRDESRSSDVWAAEHTRVEFNDGKLAVTGAKRGLPLFRGGAIDLEIALPTRSRLYVSLESADMRAEGEFSDVRFASASGDVEVDVVTGKIKATNASGSFTVHAAEGGASVATASGNVTIGNLDGDLKFKAASGSLTVDRLRGNVKSRTASGSVTVAAAVYGAASAQTSSGAVTVGIAEGTAARLDIITGSGAVTNELQPSDGPELGDETFALQVRSGSGDVNIHRASSAHETVRQLPDPAAPPAP